MSLGSGDTRGGNQRGTLNPKQQEHVYVQYTNGVKALETPSIARHAIANGNAKEIIQKNKGASQK